MSDRSDDLRSTEESIRQDAETVQGLEEQKAAIDPADARIGELSRRVEQLANGLKNKAAAERELSEEIDGAG
jgi:hypothetical protein